MFVKIQKFSHDIRAIIDHRTLKPSAEKIQQICCREAVVPSDSVVSEPKE